MADNMCLTFCHVRTTYCTSKGTNTFSFFSLFFSQDLILLPCCSFSAVFLQQNHQFFQRLHQHHHNLLITTDHNNLGTILNIPQGILLLIKLGHCPTLQEGLQECHCQHKCQCQASAKKNISVYTTDEELMSYR